jgi:hypothetical protein
VRYTRGEGIEFDRAEGMECSMIDIKNAPRKRDGRSKVRIPRFAHAVGEYIP